MPLNESTPPSNSEDEDIDLDQILNELGAFREFPNVPSKCSTCGSRSDPFIARCFVRFELLLYWAVLRTPKKIRVIVVAYLFVLPFIAPLVEIYLNIKNHPHNNMKTLIAILGMLGCLVLPIWLIASHQAQFNTLAQTLFSVLLTVFSIWVGHLLASNEATKDTATRWLPAAESAVKELVTISSTAERMRVLQKTACAEIDTASVSKKVVEMQCKETAEKLAVIRDMTENAARTWEVFIANNCEKNQCDDIGRRIAEVRTKLQASIDSENPKCE